MTNEDSADLRGLICELLVVERKLIDKVKPDSIHDYAKIHMARCHISEAAALLHPLCGGPDWFPAGATVDCGG